MKSNSIPLVKAAFKQQFVIAMINNGLSPDHYLEKVGLPIHDQDDPESLIPVRPFYHLINLIAINESIPDFGAQVAEITPWHKVKSLAPLISSSLNLEDLLIKFCAIAPSQRSHVNFLLEEDEAGMWFSYTGKAIMANDVQMELYRITSMIQLVQLATGSGWHPKQTQLMMSKTKNVQACDLISKSEISFSHNRSAISIPRILLKLPVRLDISVTHQDNAKYDIDADFVDTLRNIIAIYISNKSCKIDLIASAIGIPVRTLQRRLKHYNLCFSDLLNQVKFDIAKDRLTNSCLSIMEIAFQLGYTDPAHFTRAFHRWAGISPSQFRHE